MDICIDFDGTCVTHEYPNVGKDIGASDTIRLLVENGHRIILFTMRSGQYLDDAVLWFKHNNIPLYGVNHNPDQDIWTKSPKAYGQLYIDDSSLNCPLTYDPRLSPYPYVNWPIVKNLLIESEIIK